MSAARRLRACCGSAASCQLSSTAASCLLWLGGFVPAVQHGGFPGEPSVHRKCVHTAHVHENAFSRPHTTFAYTPPFSRPHRPFHAHTALFTYTALLSRTQRRFHVHSAAFTYTAPFSRTHPFLHVFFTFFHVF